MTGINIQSLLIQYSSSAYGKIRQGAFEELLPEEIIAFICGHSKAVQPPVELTQLRPSLEWYVADMTPGMAASIANFSGIQKVTLFKSEAGPSKTDPILTPYIVKVTDQYPTCSVKLLIDLKQQIDPTGESSYGYEVADKVLQKYGGEVTARWESVHCVLALAPASLELINELSNLDEVALISPNLIGSFF
jgi:hypothetical protein